MKRLTLRLAFFAVAAAVAFEATSLSTGPRLSIAGVIGLPAFVLMIISRHQLGTAFSVRPEAKALITTGLYSKVQHPMYLFLDLFLLALIIGIGWPILLLPWGILVVVQMVQARREEEMLAGTFGAYYETYKARTWF
jgi:protein-S-isoprenylcysteine O-methyltransferase Ste14